ncbi:MAG: hypothetical protein A2504_00315 [Bdellovibrionales bacterium RIFOXYD12_FULL_39_22]|nr:MAG: hypothetical protein A2385_13895 [Bdellovibrionales bacterium RIFOXYB1_FULL_39_21]OFZ42425.1 MAG: hypothetical protein A2485_03945 [Bdellovibrionales bacterium RIFOXYC12_FULL_39_17]OFZ45401.1 MAG: hypothetical protein A2404_01385 [Bdellovibrionales bacterium RIFOXYC1_FULL_39_130]OFZ73190.1 MAG: hypothetical protein A2451_16750 [Bdellovibrionales bacterium RIFOXYC2_FULL_39_8]OFZ74598.1 MAG: hypothetical protein A2560_09415 [Bdellovibrionales bacterium RIFOXYD1_FULL_39_84]OFZ92880.1 MAG:
MNIKEVSARSSRGFVFWPTKIPREFRTRARLLGFLEFANNFSSKILEFRVGFQSGGEFEDPIYGS